MTLREDEASAELLKVVRKGFPFVFNKTRETGGSKERRDRERFGLPNVKGSGFHFDANALDELTVSIAEPQKGDNR